MAPRRRHQRAPRHRTWGQRLLLTALSILTLGCLGAATATVWAYDKVNDLAIAFPPGRGPIIVTAYYDSDERSNETRDEDQALLAGVGRIAAGW